MYGVRGPKLPSLVPAKKKENPMQNIFKIRQKEGLVGDSAIMT
jgi:hypothetical protein